MVSLGGQTLGNPHHCWRCWLQMCAQLARLSMRELLLGCQGSDCREHQHFPAKAHPLEIPRDSAPRGSMLAPWPCSPKLWSQGPRRAQNGTDLPPPWEAKSQIIFTSDTQLEIIKMNAHSRGLDARLLQGCFSNANSCGTGFGTSTFPVLQGTACVVTSRGNPLQEAARAQQG